MAGLVDRIQSIRALCDGKRVLDMGCCNHADFDRLSEGGFLHAEIAKVAGELIGLDNDAAAVQQMKDLGFNALLGDAEHIPTSQLGLFDVVVAGELIEHLSNPGLFLDGARASLKPEGLLAATVPNAWSFSRIKQLYKGIDDGDWTHSQHTCWYSKATIRTLFERHRFEVIELAFCDLRTSNRWLKRARDWLRFWWARKPEFAESVFIVGRRSSSAPPVAASRESAALQASAMSAALSRDTATGFSVVRRILTNAQFPMPVRGDRRLLVERGRHLPPQLVAQFESRAPAGPRAA